jgi:hypothetical protein
MTDTGITAQPTEADWLAAKVAEAKAKQRAAEYRGRNGDRGRRMLSASRSP